MVLAVSDEMILMLWNISNYSNKEENINLERITHAVPNLQMIYKATIVKTMCQK